MAIMPTTTMAIPMYTIHPGLDGTVIVYCVALALTLGHE